MQDNKKRISNLKSTLTSCVIEFIVLCSALCYSFFKVGLENFATWELVLFLIACGFWFIFILAQFFKAFKSLRALKPVKSGGDDVDGS